MVGWLKFHRKIIDTELWLSEPFSRAQAWLDLLALAAFKSTYLRINGQRIDLSPGELCWSKVNLGKRWKWSRGKVMRFLTELETDHRIVHRSVGVTTVITILNWDRYQGRDTPDDTPDGTPDSTIDGTPDDTQTKKVKKIQEGEEEKADTSPATSSDIITVAELRFHCFIGENEQQTFELIASTFTKKYIMVGIARCKKIRKSNDYKIKKPCLSDLSEWLQSNIDEYSEGVYL